nr:AAA family ATPase [Alphaproteobacteria bacterium]
FQKRKDREICTKSAILENRKLWADLANKFLEREGFSERITEKSFADLGINLEATKHRGWYADIVGTDSRIAQENLEIFKENEKAIFANPSVILDYLNEKKAVFTQKDILRELNKRVFDETKIEGIFEKVLGNAKYVGENAKGEFVYTGERYQKLESEVLNQFEKIANQDAQTHCGGEVIERVLNKYDYLNDEQRDAVKTLTSDRNLSVLIGKAGAGKTTTMKAVAEIYKSSGARVIGMSLSAVASENLGREANIESGTIASWMHQRRLFEEAREKFLSFNEILSEGMLKQLDWYAQLKNFEKTDLKSSDVIIVDEAGMVGTHDWHDILEFSSKTGAKVIAVGDDNQIKPISSGDCFRAALNNLNDVGRLHEIRRQNSDWQKEASVEFSKLNTANALSIYDHHGKIHEMSDAKQIAEKFLEIEKIGSATVLCATRKECAEINSEIRNLKISNSELGENLFKIGEKSFAKNDQIIFIQNNKSFGVKNGEVAKVEKFENGILTVKSGEISKEIDIKSYDKIDHAYAITITKSQGKTYDNTIVVVNPIMDAKNTYVAMTRHRANVDLYYKNSDFKDVKSLMSGLSKYHQKDLVQDFSGGNNQYRERVQEYTELSLERISVLKDINKGEATWEDYSKINERRTEIGREIARDYSNHKLYLEQQGLTLEKLEIQCKLKDRPLSNLEIEAKNRVEEYAKISSHAHDLLSSMQQEAQNVDLKQIHVSEFLQKQQQINLELSKQKDFGLER